MAKRGRHRAAVRGRPPARHRSTFIRAWREAKGLTLAALADAVGARLGGMTHASLSRIERGIQPYSQPILEALADELTGGDVGALLTRDPRESDALWSIWERAKPAERQLIVAIARVIVTAAT
ncbi:MAG: helix-turn-helix transcriptional regulator [Hyphomicrobiales bacterium]|nr:helix-turn-helix transcriptional regulator [Hyphomicrobiales bacterium]